MANKVTGGTDTSGALSIAPSRSKSIAIIGKPYGTPTTKVEPNKLFNIVSTSDVKNIFGEDSPLVMAARILINNGVDYIRGIVVGEDPEPVDPTPDTPDEPDPPTPPTPSDMAKGAVVIVASGNGSHITDGDKTTIWEGSKDTMAAGYADDPEIVIIDLNKNLIDASDIAVTFGINGFAEEFTVQTASTNDTSTSWEEVKVISGNTTGDTVVEGDEATFKLQRYVKFIFTKGNPTPKKEAVEADPDATPPVEAAPAEGYPIAIADIAITGVESGVTAAVMKAAIIDDEPPVVEEKVTAYDLALTASLDDASIRIVLLDTNKEIASLKSHLQLCEENDMFRYSVVAPDTDKSSQVDLINFARSVNDDRIFVPGPIIVGTDAKPVDPVLAAAGLAGAIMVETDDPALPLDSVKIKGLGGVDRKVLDSEKKILANNGVTPLYTDGSTPAIWRLVTSCTDDKVWQEGTTRFIADYVLETVEETLRANYKRTKNVDRILGDTGIRGTVKSVLKRMEELEIIENFDETTLTVIKDPEDMYGALVDYEIDVVTPLYTITVVQHLKL